ncbi:hypothetical protein CGMCC3_g2199 [Colletotrichum fructicola]|nr:uncharacterized protein CGMCC3_g2199 [Colletotrichum fructicola]KAE9582096.1 hypothetical protein CGMCC3_g2199 [Colletotrichum fructicola]
MKTYRVLLEDRLSPAAGERWTSQRNTDADRQTQRQRSHVKILWWRRTLIDAVNDPGEGVAFDRLGGR